MLTKIQVIQEIKSNLRLSVPFIASQMIYSLSGFIATAMTAHLGQNALAASVLVNIAWFTLSVLFFGILNAVSVSVSHQFGAKDIHGINRFMGQTFVIGLIISLLLIALLLYLPKLLAYSHQPKVVLQLAKHYAYALTFAAPSLVYLIIVEQFLCGIGKAKVVLVTSIIIVPLEIIAIYALMFGRFGFPAVGIAALGLGFALSYLVTAVGLTLYICLVKAYKDFHIYRHIQRFHWHSLKSLLNIGLPMGFAQTIEVSGFAVLTLWMGHFGTTMLAAHQIIMQYLGFLVTLLFAMSQAVTVRIGHLAGAKNYDNLSHVVTVGMGLSFVIMLIIVTGVQLFKMHLLNLDINISDPANHQLIVNTISLFSIVALWLLIENFRIIAQGALRGLKDTVFLIIAAIVNFWIVGLPLAYLLGFHYHLSGYGLWWGFLLGIVAGGLLLMTRTVYLLNPRHRSTLIVRLESSH